jgi:D-arabinose 1-dehydrogenase-like Zn-dependent alcohol dehydrogenase
MSDPAHVSMRRATITAFDQNLELRAETIPAPTGREVLVRVRHCGVCHTDLHLRHGYYDLGGGRRWFFKDRGLVPPITPGHEIYGEVTQAGDDAQDAIGRLGVVYPWIGCGICAKCRAGQEQDCPSPRFLGFRQPGGFGDYVLLPDPRYLLDVSGIEPSFAASLACAGLTAYAALLKLQPDPDAPLVIIGAGGLGLAAIGLAAHLSFSEVVAIEPHPDRRAAALKAGAVMAIAPADMATTGKSLLGALSGVIDFVGRPETFEAGTSLLRRGGRYVLVGLFGGEVVITLPTIALRAISIIGSAVGSMAEMHALINLVQKKPAKTTPVQSIALDDVNQALDDLSAGHIVGRIVVTNP